MPTELDRFIHAVRGMRGTLFETAQPITVARGPGWVDLLGGAAADGGTLALGWPLGGGSFVALQPLQPRGLLVYAQPQEGTALNLVELELDDWSPREYDDAVARLAKYPWPVRLVGATWLAMMREEFVRFPGGARVLYRLAEGPGTTVGFVAAVAQALASAYKVHLAPRELGLLVRTVLVRADGTDPGVLGPLVSVSAHGGALLLVHQQPAWVWGGLHMPHGAGLWALRVGNGPAPATDHTARIATAMAYRLTAEAAGLTHAEADERWLGYLSNIGTAFFEGYLRARLPAEVTGADVLAHAGPLPGLTVEPALSYPVRAAAAYAVEEHLRARLLAALLRAAASKAQRDEDLLLAGELLARSHGARHAAGAADPHADALLASISAAGPDRGLYGARAPATATGATLVVLARADAEPTLRSIAARYEREHGVAVAVYGGTSSGCSAAGTWEV